MKPPHFLVGMAMVSTIGGIVLQAQAQLQPRTPLSKLPTISKPPYESELTLKFRDDLKVRAAGGNLTSAVSANLNNVQAIQTQYGLTFAPLVNLSQTRLDQVESRAAQHSGVTQPDLAGMMVVSGPQQNLEPAAQALLALAETEWVYFAAVPQGRPA